MNCTTQKWGCHYFQFPFPYLAYEEDKQGEKRRFGDIDFGYILSVPGGLFPCGKGQWSFSQRQENTFQKNMKSKKIRTLLIECADADYLRFITEKLSNQYAPKTRLLGSAAVSYCLLADGTAEAFMFAQPGGARTIDSPAGYLLQGGGMRVRRFSREGEGPRRS